MSGPGSEWVLDRGQVSRLSLESGSRTCLKLRSWSDLGSGVMIEIEVWSGLKSSVGVKVKSRARCLVGE